MGRFIIARLGVVYKVSSRVFLSEIQSYSILLKVLTDICILSYSLLFDYLYFSSCIIQMPTIVLITVCELGCVREHFN